MKDFITLYFCSVNSIGWDSFKVFCFSNLSDCRKCYDKFPFADFTSYDFEVDSDDYFFLCDYVDDYSDCRDCLRELGFIGY